ncbi:MAG: 16S rRNA (uracil(1498)-N(3))-methyltransferase [Muribaculaceae bacterium]|nr:16S rRNA (uracil(1498)-N(3))-methyltransferase [Muribaculaceae bacterium]MDE6804538.1 16S rRNA (uracil(1498)-N(3))-methyltransferase [Muribaculaceae bacterium]
MIQFYAPDLERTLMLPPDESAHCVRVLRKREGDMITVTDGMGFRYECEITAASQKGVSVSVVSRQLILPHWGVNITLAVAPTKNMDRMEWLVEKAVEIGVDRIVLLLCEHSERRVVKPERLIRIAVSAMKQSLKTLLPEVTEMIRLDEFLASAPVGIRMMGYCDHILPRRELVSEYTANNDAVIMIGPEGDFSPDEVKRAMDAGFIPVTMGESRLRTETAALFGIEAIHIINRLARLGN